MKTPALAALLLLGGISVHAQSPWKTRAEARSAFTDSWKFYKWRIERGDSLEELESILQRITAKYAPVRVNHAMVARELRAVQALRSLERTTAVGGE